MTAEHQQVSINDHQHRLKLVYDKYGGMLYGYIAQVLNNEKLAEEYLVKVFSDLAGSINGAEWEERNAWPRLLNFTKNKLAEMNKVSYALDEGPVDAADGQLFAQLTREQQHVFRGVYYYGKSIEAIAEIENKPEDLIRKTLKEAFDIIRNSCGHK